MKVSSKGIYQFFKSMKKRGFKVRKYTYDKKSGYERYIKCHGIRIYETFLYPDKLFLDLDVTFDKRNKCKVIIAPKNNVEVESFIKWLFNEFLTMESFNQILENRLFAIKKPKPNYFENIKSNYTKRFKGVKHD